MKQPVLVIMAAGMGSRYGGLKQIDPVDEQGHIMMDFSIYDAIQAGFRKVIFIIKKESEQLFKEQVGYRLEQFMETEYVFQELSNMPAGYTVPGGRVKPWGTGHAILCCKGVVEGPFAVINADDFYGREAFEKIYQFLAKEDDSSRYHYAMVGYLLKNTLTENGSVARGICETDQQDRLLGIQERIWIERREGKIAFTEDQGQSWQFIPEDKTVSLNLWGFRSSMMQELEEGFADFLADEVPANPEKAEFFLPTVVGHMLEQKKAAVTVLTSRDCWYGVTYKEDKPMVVQAIRQMKDKGLYPEQLWK